jgi:hypothetical protein
MDFPISRIHEPVRWPGRHAAAVAALPWVPRLSLLNRALYGSATVIGNRKEHG